jgi:hypothetical protein
MRDTVAILIGGVRRWASAFEVRFDEDGDR